MMTIEEFCDLHGACDDGREWALAECKTMQDVWDTAKTGWLIWVATRKGVLDDRTVRLFACWCARQVWHLLDDSSKNAVIVSERYADGLATSGELAAARYAALDVACDAARDAALGAARDAALGAAWYAASVAELYATRAAQSDWLRTNAKPCFERIGRGEE